MEQPTATRFRYIDFHQFGMDTGEDQLLIFAAPARVLAQWAGIPRKGWHIRMLYQRWITQQRRAELRNFWNAAAKPDKSAGQGPILGPTAITVAIQGTPKIVDGCIELAYSPPVDLQADPVENLQALATLARPRVVERLSPRQQEVFKQFQSDPLQDLPGVSHDYVLEFALQLMQMEKDSQWFVDQNAIDEDQVTELITALEAICRPAIVVDGQHRLVGASEADVDIWLPVVAMPNCTWTEQIYQFVVINEKAQKVESSLLTDIFGSSLTKDEQQSLRLRLQRAKVEVEARIAAVIANRDADSPFHNMVKVKLQGAPPAGANPYITDNTIRLLIEGSSRGSMGWRVNQDFYDLYVKHTIPNQPDWDGWSSGKWREYWFAFWRTVKDFYNAQVRIKSPDTLLWNPIAQTNLTKGVTLRLFQRLFMEQAMGRIQQVHTSAAVLIDELGEEVAMKRIERQIKQKSLPDTPELFAEDIKGWFLERGVPVRFFTKPWVNSLDDVEGQDVLYKEMKEAFELTSAGKTYFARNIQVFSVQDT